MQTTRICSGCKRGKPLEDFPLNRSKPGGHGYECRECEAERKRLARATSKRLSAPPTPMMSNTAFRAVYADPRLRAFIHDRAARIAHSFRDRHDFREDLEQLAWVEVAQADQGRPIGVYSRVARRAMERAQWRRRQIREISIDVLEGESGE